MKAHPRKTLLAWVLALAMLLSLLPSAALAADTDSGTCGDNLTWTLEDGVLTISGSGDMADYTYNSAPWYALRDSITSVVIGDGVTGIGNWAFNEYTGLTSVTLPDSLTRIGDYAFYNCKGLTGIILPDGLTDIGSFAFYGCTGLTGITLPDSLTTIGNSAFYDCAGLTSITIPDGVTGIDGFTFAFCESLTSVTIGSGVTSIGMWAFDGCRALTSVTLPDGVTDIGNSAFYACASLASVTIPDSVTSIDYGAFDCCTALADVYYSGSEDDWNAISIGSDNTYLTDAAVHFNCNGAYGEDLLWALEDGALVISGSGDMRDELTYGYTPWYELRESITNVVVGDGVTSIGNYAFFGCTNLTSVSISDSVTRIGGYAFYDCTSLTDVVIPDGVTSIGFEAFYNCTGLTGITMPDSVTTIGNSAFYGCSGLTGVAISDSVTTISSAAFWGCTGLTRITIPDSVTTIESYAFFNCTGLTQVTISDSVTSIDYGAFDCCTALADVYYSGSEDDWNAISIAECNDCLTCATIHFNSTGPEHTWDEGIVGLAATRVSEGEMIYTCSVCGETKTEVIPALSNATFLFSDVTNEESWYYDAVYWAYDLEITEGYSDGTFRPGNNCTRAEFTTFLYALAKAYGLENAGDTTSTSFTDVTETGWYYTYVMWAAENGLVSGYSDGTFQPNKQITRAEAVTMLYGFYKSFVNGGQEPTVSAGESGFSDLSEDSWFYTYMLWATQNGVVSGYDDGTCRPNTNCTRSVMVVLLYATANHLL